MKKNKLVLLLLILLSTLHNSCNVFEATDDPQGNKQKYLQGVAKANQGECVEAVKLLSAVTDPDDDALVALGWAQLCAAGIKSADVASSIYEYSSASSNLTVLGTLAKKMLPMDDTKSAYIAAASATFNLIQEPTRKNIEVALAQFIKASSYLASEASNSSTVDLEKDDIGPTSGCNGVDCTSGSAGCTAGMTDAEVTAFVSSIAAASTALSGSGAKDLTNLASILSSGLGAGGTQGRCFIYQRTIP